MKQARAQWSGTIVLVLVTLVLASWTPARAHLRAMSLLVRFSDAHATGSLAGLARSDVREVSETVQTSRGTVSARLYVPDRVHGPPALVIAHGVHRLGIEEPRLKNFARTIAATGVAVLTPEIRELADYRIDPKSVETIGASAQALRARLHCGPVGVMGLSLVHRAAHARVLALLRFGGCGRARSWTIADRERAH